MSVVMTIYRAFVQNQQVYELKNKHDSTNPMCLGLDPWLTHVHSFPSAYLNAPLPQDADWIVTTLEYHIAIACGLDPAQEYRIANALYGLPDSGRIFYLHYKTALLAGVYTMSAFDNCLF